HGTLRLVVRLDGERVISADPVIGYMHRGYEKLTEFRTYPQVTTLINRIDWLSSFANEVPFMHGAELLMGIEAPPRAQYIRTILTELSRIATFVLFLGEMGLQVGALTPPFYGFRDREHVLNLIEAATGGRFHPNFNRIGGLKDDLPWGWVNECRNTMKVVLDACNMLEVRRMIKVPKGELWVETEKPLGEMAYYVTSKGATGPFRVKIRSASFSNVSILPSVLRGVYVPDVITVLASLYFILGDIDR